MRPLSILSALFLASALTAQTGLADDFYAYPYSGFSLQIYSGNPGYYYYPPHHHHHHHHHFYPRYRHGHWHPGHFGFSEHHYYHYTPPRYPPGYYYPGIDWRFSPGLNINWRRSRCD